MVTKYEYMFAYTYMRPGSQETGSGRVFLRLSEPITKPEHIDAMEKFQNEQNGFTCATVNFQLIRTIEAYED